VEFYDDCSLLFTNCYTFNKPNDQFYRLGQNMEQRFDEEWARSPYAGMVAPKPRRNAGRAPQRLSDASRHVAAAKQEGAKPRGGRGPSARGGRVSACSAC
jgi:hypothetical protein